MATDSRDSASASASASASDSPRRRALEALVETASVSDAAEASGLEVETIRGWSRDDAEFVAEMNQARTDRLQRLRAEVAGLASEASVSLREILRSPDTPPAVRLRAALAVLAMTGADKPETIGPTSAGGVRMAMMLDHPFGR